MSRVIANKYTPQGTLPHASVETYFASPIADEGSEFVLVHRLPVANPGELTQSVIRSRALELQALQHPAHVPLLHQEYDTTWGSYIFIYPNKSGRLLSSYVANTREIELEWKFQLLASLADYLAALHNKNLFHGAVSTNNILLLDTTTPSIQVKEAGLQGFVSLLGVQGKQQGGALEQGIRCDLEAFKQVVATLLFGSEATSNASRHAAIQKFPAGKEFFDRLFENVDTSGQLSFSEIKVELRQIQRALASKTQYYLSLTNAAIRKLYEQGYIPIEEEGEAYRFVNRELGRGVHASSYDEDGHHFLVTTQLKLHCVHDQGDNYARVVNVISPNPSALAEDRERGMWLPYTIQAKPHFAIPSNAIPITSVLARVDAHKEELDQVRQVEIAEREFLREWSQVLDEQDRQLNELELYYSDLKIVDQGSAIIVELTKSPLELGLDVEALNLDHENLFCLTHKDSSRQEPVGIYESLDENILKLGLARDVDPTAWKNSGIVTLHNAREQAVVTRQKRALKRVRYRETSNPKLLDFLMRPKDLQVDYPPYIDVWFQPYLDQTQKSAVTRALAAQDIFLIQGPPGTGKTSVISELVLQILQREPEARILIASQSNVAVNHALTKITELRHRSDDTIRIGHAEKAGSTETLLLDRQVAEWRNKVVAKSQEELSRREADLAEYRPLSEVMALASEGVEQEKKLEGYQGDLNRLQEEFKALSRTHQEIESKLQRLQQMRYQAEAIMDRAAPQDEWLHTLLDQFQTQFVEWGSEFLKRAEEAAEIGYQMAEHDETITTLQKTIAAAEKEIESLHTRVNTYLHEQHGVMRESLATQQEFLRGLAKGQQEELAQLGRLRKLVAEWSTVVAQNTEEFAGAYLHNCVIVGATCLGIDGGKYTREIEFDWVIVDEAGRATPPEILIPLVRGRKAILVGDHKQLPPTLGREIEAALPNVSGVSRQELEKSLFQELIEGVNSDLFITLTSQYRMHPAIGSLISHCFYENTLQNKVEEYQRNHAVPDFKHAVIWQSTSNLRERYEIQHRSNRSLYNQSEVEAILKILHKIDASYKRANMRGKTVGIITGYSAQRSAIRSRVEPMIDTWTSFDRDSLEIDTVDAYQGRERDIVIYSIVRSNPQKNLGFLRDARRLNVALSRARELLIIVGDDSVASAVVRGGNPFSAVHQFILHNPALGKVERMKA